MLRRTGPSSIIASPWQAPHRHTQIGLKISMVAVKKNLTYTNSKSSKKSNAHSERLFIETSIELLRKGNHIKFSAPGDSMYPTICDGDVVTIVPVETESIANGDIILYRHTSGVAAHRVIRIEKNKSLHSPDSLSQSSVLSLPSRSSTRAKAGPHYLFFLRGDAAPAFDNPASAYNILGKVMHVERNGRRIDPYCFRVKLHYKTRRFASSIKRQLHRLISKSA